MDMARLITTRYLTLGKKYVDGVSVNFDISEDASAEDAVKQKFGKQLTVTSNYVDAKAVFVVQLQFNSGGICMAGTPIAYSEITI